MHAVEHTDVHARRLAQTLLPDRGRARADVRRADGDGLEVLRLWPRPALRQLHDALWLRGLRDPGGDVQPQSASRDGLAIRAAWRPHQLRNFGGRSVILVFAAMQP